MSESQDRAIRKAFNRAWGAPDTVLGKRLEAGALRAKAFELQDQARRLESLADQQEDEEQS